MSENASQPAAAEDGHKASGCGGPKDSGKPSGGAGFEGVQAYAMAQYLESRYDCKHRRLDSGGMLLGSADYTKTAAVPYGGSPVKMSRVREILEILGFAQADAARISNELVDYKPGLFKADIAAREILSVDPKDRRKFEKLTKEYREKFFWYLMSDDVSSDSPVIQFYEYEG